MSCIVKYLEFKCKKIVYLTVGETYWIAVKPICEALNVDYENQRKRINDDEYFRQKVKKHSAIAPGDDQLRKYVCLPEEIFYIWIFSIRSESKAFKECKIECYHVLFNYFLRRKIIREKADAVKRRNELVSLLSQNPDYIELCSIHGIEVNIGKKLKEAERGEIQEELNLFNHIGI